LEKYKKVRAERDTVVDDIIRVNRKGPAGTFVDQVIARFNDQKAKEVTLSSLGAAISKTITIAEVVKHRIPGIHQVSEIKTILLDDAYEPLDEFKSELQKITVSRKLTCFQIVLSFAAPKNTNVAGYQ
jgi:DNA-binding protein